MKLTSKIIFIFSSILLVLNFSCGNKNKPKQTKNNTISKKVEESHSLYESLIEDNSNVLFVVIDPHADGKLAINKFKEFSHNHSINVIALNNVENNLADYDKVITKDISTFKGGKDKIIMLGFSGGARMAYQYAINHNAAGLIMCGAGIGHEIYKPLPFPIVLISGTKDFNFIEQYYSPFSELVNNESILSISFYGEHEWPGVELLSTASKFILIKSGINKNTSFDYTKIMNSFSMYINNNEQFQAFKQLELLSKVFTADSTKQKLSEYTNQSSFHNYINNFEKILNNEQVRNRNLINSLPQKDINWWFKVIDELSNNIASRSSKLQYESYCRSKAYLGVAMYSFVSREINKPKSKNLKKYIKIYEKLEPENEDMLRFKRMMDINGK